jgi:hypothetical protein
MHKKEPIFLVLPYLNFLLRNIPSKKMMWRRNVYGESCTFDSKKSLVSTIRRECVVKTFNAAIVLVLKFPFRIFFSHIVLPDLMEKTKQTYVLFLLDECYCLGHNFFGIKLETKTSNSWSI